MPAKRPAWLAILREKRSEVLRGCLFAAGISIVMAVLSYYGFFGKIEGSLQDGIWLRHMQATSAKDILILEIDDQAYNSCFDGTSPMDAQTLTSLVEQIAETKPAVLGIDVLTAADKYGPVYRKFAKKLTATISTPSVWISGGSHPYTRVPNLFAWFAGKSDLLIVQPTPVLGFDPGELEDQRLLWGPAVFPTERDAKLRRFPRTLLLSADPAHSDATQEKPTWARVVADAFCKDRVCGHLKDDDVYLSVAGAAPRHESVLDFFSCANRQVRLQNRSHLEREVAGKVVLLGGTFADSGDFHESPEGRVAGILINARAVAAEIAGKGFTEIPQPWGSIFDVVSGCLVVLLFNLIPETSNIRIVMLRSLVVAIVTVLILFLAGKIFSIAAVVVATVVQQFLDFWRGNFRLLPQGTARSGRPGSLPG